MAKESTTVEVEFVFRINGEPVDLAPVLRSALERNIKQAVREAKEEEASP